MSSITSQISAALLPLFLLCAVLVGSIVDWLMMPIALQPLPSRATERDGRHQPSARS